MAALCRTGLLGLLLVCYSAGVADGAFLKLDTWEKSEDPKDTEDTVVDAIEEGLKKPAKALEEALEPDERNRKTWKGGYSKAKKGAEPDDGPLDADDGPLEDPEDAPGVKGVMNDLKEPWKIPKETRESWEDTFHGRGKAVKAWSQAAFSALLWLLLTALFGYYYRASHASPDLKFHSPISAQDWSTGICACEAWCSKPSIFCMACWCPAVRWSQTIAMAKLSDFWFAFFCFYAANLLSGIPLIGTPFAAALDTYDRIRLRETLGMPQVSSGVCMRDFCCFMCCSSCMIAQEAYHVEELAAAGA